MGYKEKKLGKGVLSLHDGKIEVWEGGGVIFYLNKDIFFENITLY